MKSPVMDFSNLSRESIAEKLAAFQISLTVDEALAVQHTFLKRPPTLAECILWSIQGSEHCSYKSTRTYLKKFNTAGSHVILGAKEDAGIVSVATDQNGLRYGIVISHESHNHPSQIVPYEGAATGVGGNVRDVSCMGAEVIALADGLRFGELSRPKTHWIHEGVVSGIAGYGNPIGVPNLAGDLYYDAGYNDNCLVTVVTLGAVREDHIIHSYTPKHAVDEPYIFILVGKPTDNSGFGGAAFASSSLESDQLEKNKGAVQEPNAFLQRHILKANMALFKKFRDEQLIDQVGFKDLGAGGVACASVELAESAGFGAIIQLDDVHTAMPNLDPAVILCSETQERFMWVVPKRLENTVLTHYNTLFALPVVSLGASAKTIGSISPDDAFIVYFQGEKIVDAKASEVTKGLLYDRPVKAPVIQEVAVTHQEPTDYSSVLLTLLSHENIASREPVYERYDKEVQGRTVIERGAASAGVMQPFNNEDYPSEVQQTGIALSLAQHPRLNQLNPYHGAIHAVLQSARAVVAVGATPTAITDCLCFGNPEIPEHMWAFSESARGIIDACAAVTLKNSPEETLPVIAGNVSLYNTSHTSAIPPSPMIACLGVLPDVSVAITPDLKAVNSALLLVGARGHETGGSVFDQLQAAHSSHFPKNSLDTFSAEIHAITGLILQKNILSAQLISEGGVSVALAKMSFKNQIGVDVSIPHTTSLAAALFAEAGGFLLEVSQEKLNHVSGMLKSAAVTFQVIGKTIKTPVLNMNGVISLNLMHAKSAWLNGLREKLR